MIQVANLRYAYPPLVALGQPVSVFRGLELQVESGSFVSIMGPTGVGKTTLCLALVGIVPHSTGGTFGGDVVVAGQNTRDTDVATMASVVGIVFQDPESQFFSMTVEDEVAFGPESLGLEPAVIADRIDWALDVVGMQAFRRRSPFELSGGQKQRAAIASILAMQPKVLVLDEPTSGLDPVGKSEVVRLVGELRGQTGMTIIMVEQDAETVAEFSDWLVVLEDGKVALEGTPREVFGQVETLERIGLASPQVSQFGDLHNKRWGTGFSFVRLGEAHAVLVQELAATEGGAGQHE